MRHILVFARAPLPGRCKTRLIPRWGALGAAKLYRQLLERSLEMALASGVQRITVWVTPDGRHPLFGRWRRNTRVDLRHQPCGDLGQRMGYALRRALDGGAQAVVIVGSDSGDLAAEDFVAAFEALESAADVFVQPAEDGGYTLIGARAPFGTRLRGVNWSSGCERRQTVARLRASGCRVLLGRTGWDVDNASDASRALHRGVIRRFGHGLTRAQGPCPTGLSET